MNWAPLTSVGDLENILKESEHQVQAIFKHSTRCSISAMAKYRLESDWHKKNPETPIHLLDLIALRELSNLISEKTSVKHESPQLILVYKGETVYHSSHISISSGSAAKHIQKLDAAQ